MTRAQLQTGKQKTAGHRLRFFGRALASSLWAPAVGPVRERSRLPLLGLRGSTGQAAQLQDRPSLAALSIGIKLSTILTTEK